MLDNRHILYSQGLFELFDKINNCKRQITLAQAKELAQNDDVIAKEIADIESNVSLSGEVTSE